MIKRFLALLSVLGVVIAMAVPAGAVTQASASFKDIDTNPNGICGYSYAAVDGTDALPGSAKVFATAMTIYKHQDPCVFGYNTAVQVDAGNLLVRGTLHCRVVDSGGHPSGEYVAWQSPQVGNAQNTGKVTVQFKGFDGSGTVFPCQGDFGLTVQARVTSRSWYATAFGYADGGTHSTAWVDAN